MLRSRFLRPARLEFREQIRHYDSIDSDVARRFVDAVEEALTFACEHPLASPLFVSEYRKRVIRRPFPFNLVYTVEEEELVVAAVWAQRRNPAVLLRRLGQASSANEG